MKTVQIFIEQEKCNVMEQSLRQINYLIKGVVQYAIIKALEQGKSMRAQSQTNIWCKYKMIAVSIAVHTVPLRVKDANLNPRRPAKEPLISAINKKKHLKFATQCNHWSSK